MGPPFYQGGESQHNDDTTRRCGSHEGLIREIVTVGNEMKHLSDKIDENNEKTEKSTREIQTSLKTLSESLSQIDPAATKTRLTYNGFIISGGVSVIIALIANADKLVTIWRTFGGPSI